jgi:hypothetical protein
MKWKTETNTKNGIHNVISQKQLHSLYSRNNRFISTFRNDDNKKWISPSFSWPEKIEAGVAGIIFDNKRRVLLMKRADNGLWGIPSGHVEPGETVEEAIIREIYEETGLKVKVNRLIGVYSDPVS